MFPSKKVEVLFVLIFAMLLCSILSSCQSKGAAPVESEISTAPGTQRLMPVGTAGEDQVRAYVEYLPANYASMDKWPLIVNLHGDGELGDGLTEESMKPFTYSCLPGMIQNDTWDKQHRFIVLSPQFSSYEDRSAAHVDEFLQYAKAHYKIDETRIYMTAVSGGGVALGNYLATYSGGEAAAVLAVSCYLPPFSSASKWSSVPAWFLLGAADSTVKPSNVVKNYTAIMKSDPTPKVKPRITLYTGVGHDANAVNKTFNPDGMDNRLETSFDGITLTPYSNAYDWLLEFSK